MARRRKSRITQGRHWFAPYHFIVTFPDRVYPFATLIDGERVRWRRSYEKRLLDIQKRYGVGRYGLKLGAYRELCHVLGAGILIIGGTFISRAFLGNDAALPAMFLLAMVVITYQEFVLQPRTYQQRLGKGVVDWFSWATPIALYFFFFIG